MNLGLNKEIFNNIDQRLEAITKQEVENKDVSIELPPTTNNLTDSNKTYAIDAAILFVDIRKSTNLTDASTMKSMVKVYRSFMRAVVACVRYNGGVTRQFLGDRIMGVFTDEKDDNGNVILSVDKAVYCARSIQTIIDFSLNKHLTNNVNDKKIECGIGIDYGKVLVTKVGMYGVEDNAQKENETDCVWVGKVTNYSSKYSDLAEGGQIFISENVYNNISDELRPVNVWKPTIKSKFNKCFKGYSTNDFYLNIANELGKPIKPEDTLDYSKNEVDIQKIYDHVIEKTKELAEIEEQLKNRELETKKERAEIKSETENLKDKITRDFDCYLIDIYDYYGMYNEAYEVMIVMAKENGYWINIQKNTILWSKQNHIVFKLKDAINLRLKDFAENTNVEKYREKLAEIEKICNGG